MKKNKTLLIVNNKTILDKLKGESNITFLFPVKDFCVGFENYFEIEEIKVDAYIFVNRILDNDGIEKFKKVLKNLPKNIKGIVFDDIGILNILLEMNSNLEKILFLNHMNCNYESINAYLEYVDSVVVSTDITRSETKEILKNVSKPVVLFVFGHVNIMYSRRTLLTNYNKHFNSDLKTIETLDETMTHKKFKMIESPYGTVVYTNEPFNNLGLSSEENVLYNLINTVFLSDDEVLEILDTASSLEEKYPYKYLSEEETIVRIKERES